MGTQWWSSGGFRGGAHPARAPPLLKPISTFAPPPFWNLRKKKQQKCVGTQKCVGFPPPPPPPRLGLARLSTLVAWRFLRSNYQTSLALKQACGWRVMDSIAEIASLTYLRDLWPQDIMEANLAHLPTKFGYKQAYSWKVINPNRVLQVNIYIWPLTYLHDLWPYNIVEANTIFWGQRSCK